MQGLQTQALDANVSPYDDNKLLSTGRNCGGGSDIFKVLNSAVGLAQTRKDFSAVATTAKGTVLRHKPLGFGIFWPQIRCQDLSWPSEVATERQAT